MPHIIPFSGFQKLLDLLHSLEWETIGPRIENDAVVLAPVRRVVDFPVGWSERQSAGRYRLQKTDDGRLFGCTVGPASFKPFLHPPRAEVWRGRRDTLETIPVTESLPGIAFIGLRPCDLHAIHRLDDVLLRGAYVDATYAERRRKVLLIVANCTSAGGTCFCDSLGTGPRAQDRFDLALTELLDGGHRFLVEVGSRRGDDLLAQLPAAKAEPEDLAAAASLIDHARKNMGRRLDTAGLREKLLAGIDLPRWQETAARCFGCGSCTAVCPTCFCVTTEDYTTLDGATARRERRWDSCFTLDFSYIHGGSVRPSPGSRHRHRVLHKLATWHDQFGTSGCTGCGRCITWCPVGIDLTEEAAAVCSRLASKEEVTDGND